MKLNLLVLVAGIAGACAAGPRTTPEEFFGTHLDCSISALAGIPAKMSAGDRAGAEKIFADYVRATLKPEVLNRDWLTRRYSEKEKKRLRQAAETTMAYNLSSCGVACQFPVGKVDWDSNPTYNQYKEWTWQLSRHPFWTDLAEYYTLTGDERAVKVWIDMITSWFDQAICPVKASPYATHCWRTIEAGIRMEEWSRQIHAFIKSPQVTDEFLTRYFISIWEHGWRLRNNPTSGNWLLMELHGIQRICLLYPFLKDVKEWEAYALRQLEEEFARQVYPDGFQYELATGYHGVVIYNYLGVFELYETLGLQKPEFIRKGLENMFDVYPRLMRPDEVTPDLNDGGHMHVPTKLRRAAELYPDRADFRWFATHGKNGTPPNYLSCVFPYAGAVVFRTSWRKDAIWAYLDGSPFGRGHQHEDKLNFLLSAYGKQMITEGGNYQYDSSDCRKYVLSTRAHNTIRINGCDQNRRPRYTWADEDIQKKADVTFTITPGHETAVSAYDEGYGPTFDRTRHERTVQFIKDAKGLAPFFVITDRLTASDAKPRAWEAMWHLEESALQIGAASFTSDFGDGVGLSAVVSDPTVSITDMKGQHEPYFQGWMPIWKGGPHEHRPIPTPVVQGSFTGGKRIVTVLYPYKDGANPIKSVKASSDVAATDVTLILSDGRELSL